MNTEEAIRVLNMAINGVPNSCTSEHANRLSEVREWLRHSAPAPSTASADAPAVTPPSPRQRDFIARIQILEEPFTEDYKKWLNELGFPE